MCITADASLLMSQTEGKFRKAKLGEDDSSHCDNMEGLHIRQMSSTLHFAVCRPQPSVVTAQRERDLETERLTDLEGFRVLGRTQAPTPKLQL